MTTKRWKMPKWMEPYRSLIVNTGGNSVEELMNDTATTHQNNHIRAALIACVISQVSLLQLMHRRGFLTALTAQPQGTEAKRP